MEAAKLRQMQLDEAKRAGKARKKEPAQPVQREISMFYPPPSMDTGSMNTNIDEIDVMCEQLFGEAPAKQPIAFKPRKGNNLDAGIKEIIDENDIRMPIKHIKDKLYLVGSDRKLCELKGDRVTIRHGGGYEPLQDYLPQKDRHHQRKLVQEML